MWGVEVVCFWVICRIATIMLTASVLSILALASAFQPDDQCYDSRLDFHPYMGPRSAYQFIRGNYIARPESSCVPVQIWMLARHGTSYPSKEALPDLSILASLRDDIVKKHESGAGTLCPVELENLRRWRADLNLTDSMMQLLTPQGKEDMRLLAKRLQTAFPELLQVEPSIVKSGDFIFRATETKRTQNSMKSFVRGLLGNSITMRLLKPSENDTLMLRPHENCPAWNISCLNGATERDKFTEGLEMHELVQRLNKRLGFNESVGFETVKSMYDMCRLETAWYPDRTSVWCALFRQQDLSLLEYREDLGQYYSTGPGNELSGRLGCQILTDMFQHFKTLESDHDFTKQPKGIFYFAHTVTVQSLLSLMRIGKECPSISAVNYATAGSRKFRSSLLSPFAANLVAVFYRCSGMKSPNKVTFYASEKLVPLAGCQDGLCDWEFLKREFGPDMNNCSSEFCYELPESELTEEAKLTAAKAGAGPSVAVVSPMVMLLAVMMMPRLWAKDDWMM